MGMNFWGPSFDGDEPVGTLDRVSSSVQPDFLGKSWLGDVPCRRLASPLPADGSSALCALVIFSLVSPVGCTEKRQSI